MMRLGSTQLRGYHLHANMCFLLPAAVQVMNSKQGVNMVMGTAGCIVGLILLWYFLNR